MDSIINMINALEARQRDFDSLLASQRAIHNSIRASARTHLEVAKYAAEHSAVLENLAMQHANPSFLISPVEMFGLPADLKAIDSLQDGDSGDDQDPPSRPIGFRPHSDD